MTPDEPHRAARDPDYDLLDQQATALLADERDFIANAANFAAFLFLELPNVNWAGFYFPSGADLVLGPFAGKPACTRLPGGRGVCGAAFEGRRTVVVDDVHAFADHIVCDSASKSEIVVPLIAEGTPVGVFDVDSPLLGRFSERDRAGLERLVGRFLTLTPVPERYKRARFESDRLNERIDIQTCRDHHVVIRYLVEELAKSDVEAEAALGLLKRLRTVLLAHLKLEDDWLYPRLAASPNAVVRHKAERYRNEMGGLRAEFVTLYETWSAPAAIASNPEIWRSEWRIFERNLTARMNVEDHDLYVAAEADLTA